MPHPFLKFLFPTFDFSHFADPKEEAAFGDFMTLLKAGQSGANGSGDQDDTDDDGGIFFPPATSSPSRYSVAFAAEPSKTISQTTSPSNPAQTQSFSFSFAAASSPVSTSTSASTSTLFSTPSPLSGPPDRLPSPPTSGFSFAFSSTPSFSFSSDTSSVHPNAVTPPSSSSAKRAKSSSKSPATTSAVDFNDPFNFGPGSNA